MFIILTTTDDVLEQSFTLYGKNLRLTLRYNAILTGYQFDLFDIDNDEYITKNKGLSVGSPSMIEFNLPFVLVLDDKSGLGINAISKDDLNNRMQLLIMTKEEYRAAIRQGFRA
ncbi:MULTISPECIES: phage baseplate plug family protein [unclassified Gilliamella]|uniref:phage baseplate plug family protein n=1 Tax=unclassified Gilliamella TaxID=2685620 RepID=UPI00226A9CAE|nr:MULTISPECIES: hypothetical protein [unclassified Gilliamella]MCX8602244.1 hypothetical protein [Gilliamella sp. B3722]MCX8607829.1 hypothetical protein [Gilliamella sp. B3771]MCX8611514.1 hypothetical protein [Gilliamella sp. B3891]MCX8613984.1 hypothetical protein [Gilliamella sp. B3773]MCX8615997.1 hypothetical protein [Gilliamella sp. B3770]